MAETSIEWTERTWNPVTGCDKVSAGCKNCYAERQAKRLQKMSPKYRNAFRVTTHEDALDEPLRRKKPTTWFVCSMADLFHEDVPDEFIAKVFGRMACCPQHTFQVLTKRPERAADFCRLFAELNGICDVPIRLPLPNVWIGTSVENQAAADERIPHLLRCPAAVRFLSCEPLLGPVRLSHLPHPRFGNGSTCNALTGEYLQCMSDGGAGCGTNLRQRIDWVIAAGESGPQARAMHPDWARSLRDQCADAGVAFFFKQWGEWKPTDGPTPATGMYEILNASGAAVYMNDRGETGTHGSPYSSYVMRRVGKKAAGRLLDGVTHDAFPNPGAVTR